MILKTKRLTLRPWTEEDAPDLFQLAKDPNVGPITGWPVHTSLENSLDILKDVLLKDETYAIVKTHTQQLIGDISLMIGSDSKLALPKDEAEIGYWLGVPYWGSGFMPEAVDTIIHHAFNTLQLSCLWCGYFIENNNSKRVGEKTGFNYHHTQKEYFSLINQEKIVCVTRLTKDEWEKQIKGE